LGTGIGFINIILFFLIFIGPIFIIWFEKSGRVLNRGQFAARAIGLILFNFALSLAIQGFEGGTLLVAIIIYLLISAGFLFFLYRWVVQRARDAGLGKTIAYVSIIPVVNLGILIYLIAKKTAEVTAENSP
jgi:uncharacterized membrane protein YhaH (DUF805 family)